MPTLSTLSRRASRTLIPLFLGALCGACATPRAAGIGVGTSEEAKLCRQGLRDRAVGQALGWSGVGTMLASFAMFVGADYPTFEPARENRPLAIAGGVAMGAGAVVGLLGTLYLWGSGSMIQANCPQ